MSDQHNDLEYDICYHHSDLDGYSSAAIIGAKLNLAVGYKTKINNSSIMTNCHNKNVAIVDFSFPMKTMKFFKEVSKELLWIDHHEDSKPIIELGLDGIHDISKAAARLTWEYKYKDKELPDAIKFVADRDIWKFEYKETEEYCYGLNLLDGNNDPGSELWQFLLSSNELTEKIIEKGLTVKEKINEDCLWHSRLRVNLVKQGKEEFIITNCTNNISEVAQYLIDTFKVEKILLWDIAKNNVALHGRGKNVRTFFNGLLKGHEDACGGGLDFDEGLSFIKALYKQSRRIMP